MDRVLVLSGWVSRLDGQEGWDRNPSNTPNPRIFDPAKNTYEILTGCKTAQTGQEDRLDRVLVLSGWVSRLDGQEGWDRNPSNTPNPVFSTPPKTPMRFLQAVKPHRRGRKTVWTAFSYFRGGCHGLVVVPAILYKVHNSITVRLRDTVTTGSTLD